MTLGDRVVVMNEGHIQQCDTPLTVYNAPSNRFVAGFLGTPPMNFIEGELAASNGELRFQGDGVDIRLPRMHTDAVGERAGQPVTLGIRAEGLFLRPNEYANGEDQTMKLRVDVIEPLGNMMDLYAFTQSNHRLVARVRAQELDESGYVKLYMDPSKLHVFEPGDHGRNLTLAVAGTDAAAV